MSENVWESGQSGSSSASGKAAAASMLGFLALLFHLSACFTSCFGWMGATALGFYAVNQVNTLRASDVKLTEADEVHLDWAYKSGLAAGVWGAFLLLIYGLFFLMYFGLIFTMVLAGGM